MKNRITLLVQPESMRIIGFLLLGLVALYLYLVEYGESIVAEQSGPLKWGCSELQRLNGRLQIK